MVVAAAAALLAADLSQSHRTHAAHARPGNPPAGSLTQGFDVYNLSGAPLQLVWDRDAASTWVDGPLNKNWVHPGEAQHFEGVFLFGINSRWRIHYGVGVGGRWLSVDIDMLITGKNTTATGCVDASGLACVAQSRRVLLMDPTTTVHDIPAGQGQQQAALLNQLCVDPTAAKCTFTPTKRQRTQGAWHVISKPVSNRTGTDTTTVYREGDDSSITNSIGVELSFTGTLFKLVETTLTGKYQHEWTESHHFSQEVTIPVKTGYKAWLAGTNPVIRDTGDFTVTMGNTTWQLRGVYFDSPDPSGKSDWHIFEEPITGGKISQVS